MSTTTKRAGGQGARDSEKMIAPTPALPDELVGELAAALIPAPLSAQSQAAVFARISAKIASASAAQALPSFQHGLVASSEWQKIGPGVAVKVLRRTTTHEAFLVRIDTGCELPEHGHDDGDEESVLLEGDAWIGDVYYGTVGDSHLAARGTTHGAIRSPKGCMLHVRVALG
jgi:quercetin dioxygenase-like cupin family protein